VPAGTYFANVEVEGDGAEWCRALVPRAGVVAIPTSVFSTEPARLRPYVRFAFCKRLGVIDAAAARLVAPEAR
jgi:N-succinyldiaminopimelate aminotransferase